MVRSWLFSRRIPILALFALIITGLISLPVGNTLWTETLTLGAAAAADAGGRPESEAAVMPTPTAALPLEPTRAPGEAEWDYSSLGILDYGQACGESAEVWMRIENNGEGAMQGESAWVLYRNAEKMREGALPALPAGETYVISQPVELDGLYEFRVMQNPGHPEGADLWSEPLEVLLSDCGLEPERPTETVTGTPTETPTAAATELEAAQSGPTVAGTPTPTATRIVSVTPGEQPAVPATFTASPSATQPAPTATPTHTATVMATPTASATITPALTDTPVPSIDSGETVVEETQVGN